MAPDGAIDPYEAPYTGQRVQRENFLSFAILEFLNQFSLCFPLTQINSHLWRGKDKREEWDHLLGLTGENGEIVSSCQHALYLFIHLFIAYDCRSIKPDNGRHSGNDSLLWLNANGGQQWRTNGSSVCTVIDSKFSLLYLKMHVKWCIHPQESIKKRK